ncbi:MAG: lipid-A-disaccharide synthase [Candidatus Omnitrophica bacterium]|nr:lipid-A-disaccharide synthase [Candidatus Omnitrophota bacterium]
MKKIVLIAGDRSGDLYGGLLCQQLKRKYSDLELYSFGGDNLAKTSIQLINLLSHSVSGLIEVAASLKNILEVFNRAIEEINKIKPDLIVPIDFPDFNLRLLKKLNKKFPVFYYISPQVWAWRKKRINILREFVDKMVVIFRFEKDFYKAKDLDAEFFGHPLLDIIGDIDSPTKNIITFLPGSRMNEVKKHLPLMIQAKNLISKELKGFAFRVLRPKNIDESVYNSYPLGDIKVENHSYELIKESKFIITASGTATVEIAILEIPYLIIYKVNPLTWFMLKRLVKTEFIGMVNILNSKKIIKELLQYKATPENIATITLDYLRNENLYTKLKTDLQKTKDLLKPYHASERFAEYIGDFLKLKS